MENIRRTIIINKNDIKELVDKTAKLSKDINKLTKELDVNKSKIKEYFAEFNLSEYPGTDFIATVSTQVKETLNEQRTIDCIKTIGADWLLHTKEYFKEDEIESSIMTGELEAGLFSACVDKKETKVLKFKKNKKETVNG